MRLLLDTHVALWAVTGDKRLSAATRRKIEGCDEVFVSAASLWEIAIKHALGRGDMPVSADVAGEEFVAAGMRELPISWSHVCRVGDLTAVHRDPFDRLLVAQALVEPLTLVTHDPQVAAYSPSFWRV